MNNRAERGVVLGMVLITSVIFGIAAFGLLFLAMSQSTQTVVVSESRTRARYAAESGLVMAMQELWANPLDCAFGPYNLDTNNDGINETTVTVAAVPCPAPGIMSTLQATVTF